ncbi:hypothetical protein LTR84_008575 [Exophiala bonariae]|uniref:Zn(2)-C6 fungal-type domain-containing protein n=1 Tax=Exophiala bonariae TaxID=1690606 RepID=A0AAV9MZP9_9EURO|nr:hypothetical protein LTR84_008575 [Exophiala bonariae]
MNHSLKDRARLVCVQCHERKIRCNLQESNTNVCTNCSRLHLSCVRREGVRKRKKSPRRQNRADGSSTPFLDASDLAVTGALPSPSLTNLQQGLMPSSTTRRSINEQEFAYLAEHSVLNTSASSTTSRNISVKSPSNVSDGIMKLRAAVLKASEADVLPKQPLRRALIDSFFCNIGHAIPIISRSEVCEPDSSILLQQVVCLAGNLTRHPHPQYSLFQEQLYQKIKLLIAMNVEPNMLIVLKAKTLLTLWSPDSSNVVSLDSPWHAGGSAVRLAQQMGLHRHSTYSGRADAGCRRRIWWALYASDRAQSLMYGRPPSLTFDSFDVPFLTIEDFEEDNLNARIFMADTSLCHIEGEIATSMSRTPPSALDHPRVISLLSDWIGSLHKTLRLHDDEGSKVDYHFGLHELYIEYLGTVILASSLTHENKQCLYSVSSIIAASSMTDIYEEILCREHASFLGSIHGFWCMVAALPLLYCIPESDAVESRRKESLDVLRSILDVLRSKFGVAETVAQKVSALTSERQNLLREHMLEGDNRSESHPDARTNQQQISDLEALFINVRNWYPHIDQLLSDCGIIRIANPECEGFETGGIYSLYDALGSSAFTDTLFDDIYLDDNYGTNFF